jgi:hypothetical protein
MTEEVGATPYQVVYVGTGRRKKGWFANESEEVWRRRLAQEQQDVCNDRAQRGLSLVKVVPVLSSGEFRGSWTEGVWLYFAAADAERI